MPLTPELIGQIAIVALCLAIGGVLKGATGAGAPILAVPAITALFDVRLAIAMMCMPNVLTNGWQAWRFRESLPPRRFIVPFVGGGVAGVIAGTLLLATLPADKLSMLVGLAVSGYVAIRLARPHWRIERPQADRLALPVGMAGGFLQGASGLSAPVSLTFLNAMRLERPAFIATVSLFFTMFGLVQTVALSSARLLSATELLFSFLALAPIWAAMPLGAWLARRMPPEAFDRIILVLLSGIALKLLAGAVV
jgi:uncharacterized membrane protein YfcA